MTAPKEEIVVGLIHESKCDVRSCRHYLGVAYVGEGEAGERHVCAAFPDGIPDEIAFGNNKHLKPYPGDHGIIYEKES